ncbi:hypothetical protein PCO31010_03650 [Pandoraea commovens]|uniref:Uncharacterized protein n=1 Tax=Pandoraea commovens TaxID=2508289 RepID=A0A5E4X2M8_9BURK|nr:hypothetical protein PCO31010_03650 [Pandoraea commovens]
MWTSVDPHDVPNVTRHGACHAVWQFKSTLGQEIFAGSRAKALATAQAVALNASW